MNVFRDDGKASKETILNLNAQTQKKIVHSLYIMRHNTETVNIKQNHADTLNINRLILGLHYQL